MDSKEHVFHEHNNEHEHVLELVLEHCHECFSKRIVFIEAEFREISNFHFQA